MFVTNSEVDIIVDMSQTFVETDIDSMPLQVITDLENLFLESKNINVVFLRTS